MDNQNMPHVAEQADDEYEAPRGCISPLATRPILYTDTVGGQQTCRDDLWAVTTDELNALTRQVAPEAPTDDLNDIARYEPIVAPMGYDHVPEMAAREDGEYVKLCDVEAVLREQKAVAPATQQAGAAVVGRDWIEDATHENGNYQCRCSTCGNTFIGHKRRVTCKACAAATTASADPDGDFAKGMLTQLSRMGASPAALSLAVQLFGVGPCERCGYRKIHCRCQPAATTASASDEPYAYAIEQPNTPTLFLRDDPTTYRKWQADGLPVTVRDLFIRTQAPSRDAAPTIKTWQERMQATTLTWKTGEGKAAAEYQYMVDEISDLRAALARAPLPAQGDARPVAWLKFWAAQYSMGEGNIGVDEGLEVCSEGEIGMDGRPAFPVYAAPAQAGDARDAARSYIDWWTSIETDVRKSMLVFAHREPERLHALVKQAYEEGQQSMRAASAAEQKGPQ